MYAEGFDQESVYYSNRAAAYISTKRFRLGLADCQRAVSLRQDNPTAKVLLRLGRCHFALGNTMPALTALRQVLAVEPENSVAQAFHKKVISLQGHVRDFEGARSRSHWRMAQSAYEMCVKALEDEQGEIPVEWKCWGIELDIARAKWEEACEVVECAPSSP